MGLKLNEGISYQVVPMASDSYLDGISDLSKQISDLTLKEFETKLDAIEEGYNMGDPEMILIEVPLREVI